MVSEDYSRHQRKLLGFNLTISTCNNNRLTLTLKFVSILNSTISDYLICCTSIL